MKKTYGKRNIPPFPIIFLIILFFTFISTSSANPREKSGEELFKKLTAIARGKGDVAIFNKLNNESRKLNWEKAETLEFAGNLRLIESVKNKKKEKIHKLYLLRKLTGEIFILTLPEDPDMFEAESDSYYSNLEKMLENKMVFKVKTIQDNIDGESYGFAQFLAKPYQVLLDRIFKICIVLMLFFVMIGMGLTLTLNDFTLVFKSPRGIILGEFLQFGLMPLVAFGLGHLMGFYEHYPFIFVGMILIMAIPGGVTSNLMTYYARGDLALSISMTSFSTVLSLIFTPLLLGIYCSNVPDVNIPVKSVVQTILILVIIPLAIGMSVRAKWLKFAEKATPFFSILGIIALLFLIIAGVVSNLHSFADTERLGVKFYSMVFLLTTMGIFFGALLPKLFRINNYQTRAISLESGLRNASLSMAIALLIQDMMGDFHSSMFVVSGIFGLMMYLVGAVSILLYKKVLPVEGNLK